MTRHRLLIATACAILCGASPSFARTVGQDSAGSTAALATDYQLRTLANGLQVLSLRDTRTTDVTVQVWYRVGSADDPQGRSGFAHLFEHMMFKATRNLPEEAWDSLTESVGGLNNAGTFPDFTWYFSVVPAGQLERLLFAEAERMGSLVVDTDSLASETSVVQEEFRQRVLADPYGRLNSLYVRRDLYRGHAYGRAAIGSLDDLSAATVEDVRRFHATYYRPDNALLVVAGNYDPQQLEVWIDDYFGDIPAPALPIPSRQTQVSEHAAPRLTTYYAPNVPLPAVTVGWPSPPLEETERAALQVLNGVLSTGQSSRLYRALVYEDALATRITSTVDTQVAGGALTIQAIVADGREPADAEAAILRETARLAAAPVSEAELEEAKTELIAGLLRGRETIDRRAHDLGLALMMTGDASSADREVADIRDVTAADVQRVAQQRLSPDRRVVVRYLDESRRPADAPSEPTPEPVAAPVQLDDLSAVYAVVDLTPAGDRRPLPAPGPEPVIETPAVIQRTLTNGLRVYVARRAGLPLISARLSLGAGSADDPQGLAGLASLTASVAMQGAGERDAPAVAAEIERLGAVVSAVAGADTTTLSVNSPVETFPAALALLSDVSQRPTLSDADFERQRNQALAGLRVEMSQPMMTAYAAVGRAVYGDASYGSPGRGTPAGLSAIALEDVAAFHAARWRPETAILVFSGDIEPETAFSLAQAAFGDWVAARPPVAASPDPDGAPVPPRIVVIDMPGAGQAGVYFGARAVARTDPDYPALLVANSLLGGGFSGRLNRLIRVDRGLAYYALSGFVPREGEGIALAFTQTRNDAVPEVLGLIRQELVGLAASPAAEEEFASRQTVLIGTYGRGLETADGLGSAVAALASAGLPADLTAYAAAVRSVTAEDVRRVAGLYLDPARASIVIAGDAGVFLEALRASYPQVEVIPATELDLDTGALR